MILRNIISKYNNSRSLHCIITSLCIIYTSCSDNSSSVDAVKIIGVNTYITSGDIATGIKKTLETSISVTMPHLQHEKAGVECLTCHHKKSNNERIKTCSYCHKGLKGAKLLHGFCIKCHASQKKGPKHCNECHKEKIDNEHYEDIKKVYARTFSFTKETHAVHENATVRCIVCHHDTKENEKKKKCTRCHVGKTNMVILHSLCKDCHKKKTGPVRCQECHKGTSSEYQTVNDIILIEKTGHRLPQIRFNHRAHIEQYNTECIDCHHLGSTKKCSRCHTNKDQGAVINLKGAYHLQCHECHRRTAGPRGCQRCHRGKK